MLCKELNQELWQHGRKLVNMLTITTRKAEQSNTLGYSVYVTLVLANILQSIIGPRLDKKLNHKEKLIDKIRVIKNFKLFTFKRK